MLRWIALATGVMLLTACASKSSDVTASCISPVTCSNYTCQQPGFEAQAVAARAATLSGAQDDQRTHDQIATGVAIVVFWPAAFLVGGDKQTAAELAQMKGQMAAIEQASIQKNCGITFNHGHRRRLDDWPAKLELRL
jgi:hypothetical protein